MAESLHEDMEAGLRDPPWTASCDSNDREKTGADAVIEVDSDTKDWQGHGFKDLGPFGSKSPTSNAEDVSKAL